MEAAGTVVVADEKDPVRILVVDDRLENVMALEAMLETPGYEVVRALSGEAALKEVLQEEFAVILLDVQMPGLDGFETAALIRKRRKSRMVPIIFITAIDKEERYVCKGYSLGAVDYLFKPLDVDMLRAKVAVFADLYSANRQIKAQARLLQESERRERARQLAEVQRRCDRRYRNLADFVPHLIWAANSEGHVDYLNRRALEYTGADLAAGAFPALQELFHPDDLGAHLAEWTEVLRLGGDLTAEMRLRCATSHEYRWHVVHIQGQRDAGGQVRSWLGTAADIDEQRRMADALAAEKERLAVTLRSIGDGVITTDENVRVALMNKAAEVLTGWTQDEALGRPLSEVFALREDSLAGDDAEIADGRDCDRRAILISRDGRERWIAECVAPIRDATGIPRGRAVVFRDITDAQRLEEERQKAGRLESVGLLAGAIAHDFNNILTAIMGNISLAKLYCRQGEKIQERLDEAERAALWAKDLTHQLLTFAKGGAPVKRPIEIATVARDAAEFACRGSGVLCEVEIDANPIVEADEGQIRQVMHNLVLNAQQAMPGGGRVRVVVREVNLPVRVTQPLPAGRYAEISCEDQGGGIESEHLPKIFDPYFTTKEHGSGLGLATTYSIIRKHSGFITVESQVGTGTVFRIYLPLSDKTAARENAAPVSAAGGCGRILVMDDECFIRDILGRFFTHFGYEVGYAKDGSEALVLYKAACEEGRPYHLVIMDLVIPGGMGGREAIGQLLEIDPQAKVVVSSGYSNDPIMADYRRYGFQDAIAKPYRNEELRAVVQRLLAR